MRSATMITYGCLHVLTRARSWKRLRFAIDCYDLLQWVVVRETFEIKQKKPVNVEYGLLCEVIDEARVISELQFADFGCDTNFCLVL
jgi:hypothetical protein